MHHDLLQLTAFMASSCLL